MEDCCHVCGDREFSPNIEAFEASGELTCDDCAEGVLDEFSPYIEDYKQEQPHD